MDLPDATEQRENRCVEPVAALLLFIISASLSSGEN